MHRGGSRTTPATLGDFALLGMPSSLKVMKDADMMDGIKTWEKNYVDGEL